MSLLDILAGQQLILITILVALIPLLAAAALVIVPRIRRRWQHRQAEKARAASQAAQWESISLDALADLEDAPETGNESAAGDAPIRRAKMGAGSDPAPEDAPEADAAAHTGEQSDTDDVVSDAMQSILSDVFTDDEASARMEALLDGLEPIAMTDLADMCQQIAGQLQPGRPGIQQPTQSKEVANGLATR